MLHLLALVLIAAGLALLGMGGYLTWNSWRAEAELLQADASAAAEATRLAQQLQSVRAALRSDDFGAEIAGGSGTVERNGLIALLREQDISNVLNVVVARAAIEDVDLSSFPGSGFAALEMLLQARREAEVPAQVHFAGSPDEYLAIAERLETGNSATAVVLVSFPVSVIAQRLQLPAGVDGLRLVQRAGDETRLLFSRGQNFGTPSGEQALAGTLFALQWYTAMPIGPMSTLQLAGVAGVGLLMMLLGALLRRRSLARRARAELVSHAEFAEPETASIPAAPGVSAAVAEPQQPPEPTLPAERVAPSGGRSPDGIPAIEPEPPLDQQPEPDLEPQPEPQPEPEPEPETRSRVESKPAGEAERSLPAASPEPVPASPDQPPAPGDPLVPDASIFKAYDVRGVVGRTLNAEVAHALGRAIGSEAVEQGLNRIAVARDGRLSGAELLAALARGLLESGVDVIEVGAVPTPLLYFAAYELTGGSGVMVTGSHNPPDYNGFKIVLGGETLAGDRIQQLRQRLLDGRLAHGQGQLEQADMNQRYLQRIASEIQLERPLKVVVDCGNGIAGMIAPQVLGAIGAEVIPLYTEVDGTFPNHHPDPGDPHTLEDLKLCVRNFNGDLGVAFDGDGDRLGVVAADGEIIYADRLMMLFARDVLARNPDAEVIFDVKCSGRLAREITEAGGRPVMARTGHSFLKAELQRRNAPLAGEMSGHFFFGERWYGFDDGIYAAARLLEILAIDARAPGQVLAALPKAHSTPELKVEMNEGETHPFVSAFKLAAEFPDAEINTLDGLRADFADGFGLVRASNTTPILVLRFEGETRAALVRIQQQFREQMLKVNPALKLPI
ncbi:MAG: phosphomannomutase/phosphoglucomutase [Wenzhouxiangellaceae bacterium]|nr:phosphomannomutase/phosphoglucomutase [Wenzhouxiangellaceae bacterium]